MGMLPLNATTNVSITILDENDNSPIIQNITVQNGDLVTLRDNISLVIIPEDHPPYTPVSNLCYWCYIYMNINSLLRLMLLILMRVGMEILFIYFKIILIILILRVSDSQSH